MRAVTCINPLQVGHVWPAVEPMVKAALDHGDGGHEPDDLLYAIRRKLAVLWIGLLDGAPEMAAVTEIVQRPQQRVARIMALGGQNIDAWLETGMPALDAWARAEGCTEWEMVGRRGWLRCLPDWKAGGVVMRRALA